MIYLIGGPPRTGKSILAEKLSARIVAPWISTDAIEVMIKPYIPKGQISELYPKSEIRKLTGGFNENMYAEYSAREIADAYLKQGKVTEKAIEQYIDFELSLNKSIIIEGHHLHPYFVSSLISKHGKERIKAIFLTKKSSADFLNSINEDTDGNCWVKNKSKSSAVYPKVAKILAMFSREIDDSAKQKELTTIEYTSSFTEQVDRGISTLLK